MSHFQHTPPSAARLLKATALAIAVAGVVLVATVLPAEYGIDPTGIGSRLGLDVLASPAQAAEAVAPVTTATTGANDGSAAARSAEKAKSIEVFGEAPGQAFDVAAVSREDAAYLRDTMSVEIAPGKGAEIKTPMKAGDSIVFHWTASGDVAVDMHGDRTDAAKDEYTSYWIEGAQRRGSGTLTAPFDGNHGWYWLNRGNAPVTVQVEVSGFHEKLFRPGH